MYTIEQLSLITGLTTRTLRSYLKTGILSGSKETGFWQFSEEQVSQFVRHPAVRPSIAAKQHAIVYDFLADRGQEDNEMCMLLHRTLAEPDAKKLADFFCGEAGKCTSIRFAYAYDSGKARFILRGAEADVRRILDAFYEQDPMGRK